MQRRTQVTVAASLLTVVVTVVFLLRARGLIHNGTLSMCESRGTRAVTLGESFDPAAPDFTLTPTSERRSNTFAYAPADGGFAEVREIKHVIFSHSLID